MKMASLHQLLVPKTKGTRMRMYSHLRPAHRNVTIWIEIWAVGLDHFSFLQILCFLDLVYLFLSFKSFASNHFSTSFLRLRRRSSNRSLTRFSPLSCLTCHAASPTSSMNSYNTWLLGTPTEKLWPGVSSLRDWHVYPQWEPQNLARVVPSLGPDGVDLLSLAAPTKDIEAPTSEIQDKISFIINNLSSANVEAKAKEFSKFLKEQFYPWFARYLVMKRLTRRV